MQSKISGKLTALLAVLALMLACSFSASAQTLTTGAVSGVVTDPSGAVVPNATVTATSVDTNSSRTVQTQANGVYSIPQLGLGDYRISVKAAGFRTSDVGPISVQVAQTATADVTLEVGTATQTVEVTAQGSIIQTDNPNTTTAVNSNSIANLPNPGGDLTFEAQVAPGALMNSSGGYGNVEYNGLPSGANNFTIDGLDDNDPFLNLNNSGATNLLLGSDAIQEVTVNTTSYATDQGRLSAAQINYTTKSGTNQFHGAAHEIWNGSKFNSTDFFVNSGVPFGGDGRKPRSNVNDFAANVGGPIVKDKWFFFADLEGTRIVVPVTENDITYPSAAYQSFVLNTTLPAAGASAQIPFYQNIFSLYNTPANAAPVPTTDCSFDVGGGPPAITNTGNGCAVHSSFSLSNRAKETLVTAKVDRAGDKNQLWFRFQLDNGTQPTYTDPINPIFNAISIQPERNGNAGWTHTFGPNLVNQFNPGAAWYTAKFKPLDINKTLAAFPEVLGNFFADYPFTGLGGIDFVWPQGRDVTQYQINDNLTWTKGKHTMIFGENMRRVLVSDFDFGFFNTPIVGPIDFATGSGVVGFQNGSALSVQNFPITLSEPIGIINLDSFFNDNFKVTPKFTFIYGVRATWNGNPVNQHGLYSRPSGDFNSFPHDVNTPINAVLKPTSDLFPNTPKILWQPRGAIAWQVRNSTVVRAGFGVFSDIFPASLADSEAQNPPFDPEFVSFGDISNTTPNGLIPQGIAANQNFQAGFNSGVLSCAATNAPANCLAAAGFTGVPSGQYQYPYSLQWSAGVEQQWANNWGLKVQYVGTRQVHEPYQVNPNLTALCAGCFSPIPSVTPDARFAGVTQFVAGAGSHYHALQVEGTKRLTHGLQFSLNYTYSHCLDTISNGGIFAFANSTTNIITAIPGDLQRNVGDCDYDVRHAFNGNYLYELPFHSSTGWINQIIGGWQVSGDVFLRGGFPFTALSSNCTNDLGSNGTTTPPCYANQIPGVSPYQQFGNQATLAGAGINAIQWLNPNAFVSVADPSSGDCTAGETIDSSGNVIGTNNNAATCQFGSLGRNTLRAPHFRWADVFITKRFKLTERVSLRLDGQFYNVFNHPNFTYPSNGVGNPLQPGTTLGVGTIGAEVTPPTGLLGSFLGGDNAVRQIAFQARIDF